MDGLEILRILVSFFSGALFSVSGSLVQGVTRNDLAGPSTLGFEGVVVVLILISYAFSVNFIPLSVEMVTFLLLMLLCLILAYMLFGMKSNKTRVVRNRWNKGQMGFYLLTGLCLNLFVGALFAIIQFMTMSLNIQFPSGIWFGNFRYVTGAEAGILIGTSLIIFGYVFKISRSLQIMAFGEDLALSYGISVGNLQKKALFISFIATGVVTAFFGVFAFAGLIFPHLLRSFSFFKRGLRRELLLGPILAGLSFTILDIMSSQILFLQAEIPVGMLSSLLGTLLLLLYLVKMNIKRFKT